MSGDTMQKMKFRAHDTFFIRKGWLYKGLKNVTQNAWIFNETQPKPSDVLGLGTNMVKSLRYWLQAVGLTKEPKAGKRFQTLTELGELIFEQDKYNEELGTLFLLHYKLATNRELATAWYYFFNEFNRSEFDHNDFVYELENYINLHGLEVSTRSLEDDFKCIMNTYLPRIKSNPTRVHPENNIDCPFGELGFIDLISKTSKTYKKLSPKTELIPPLVALAVIVDQSDGEDMIKISRIQNDKGNIGKIFNLDIIAILEILNQLESLKYIKVVRTAGLDVININQKLTFIDCVKVYYENMNN